MRTWLIVGVATALTTCLVGQSTAGSLKEETSLKFVPADVAFYSSTLRTGEQVNRVLTSKAFAKVKEMPMVQMGWFMLKSNWDNPQNPQVAGIKQMLQQDANKQLVALVQDALSHEIFMIGDASFGDQVKLLLDLYAAINQAQMNAAMNLGGGGSPAEQIGQVLDVLSQNADRMQVPNVVIGFKVTDAQIAASQLQRLEALIGAVAQQQPLVKERYSKETIGAAEYLTVRLDGSLVPWQQIPLDELGVNGDAAKQLIEKLQKLTLVISLGVREDYVLLSIGADNKLLGKLGNEPLLYDASELAPLRAKEDLPFTSLSFASKDLMGKLNSVEGQMDQMATMVKQLAPMMPLPAEAQEEFASDIDSAVDYIKGKVPAPAAVSGYTFMTPEGYESFSYLWTTESSLDASQKLSVLEHVGGDPLAFFAARAKSSPEDVEVAGKILKRAAYYAEQIITQQIDEQQQQAYTTLKERLTPLYSRAVETTKQKLIPSMADDQGAIVLDAKSTSTQWHMMLPPADQPLPMLELGMVQGVSDAGKLKEAFAEYFDILQETLDTLHELSTGDLKDFFPDEIPAIKLAKPQMRTVGDGAVYYYVLPEETGLDAQLAPNAGLSESVVIGSLMPKFTARLLKSSPLQGTGPLANVDRPLGAAGYLNFAGIIEAIEPWIGYGMKLAGGDQGPGGGPMGGMAQQATDVLEIIKCFRGVGGVTYEESGATVSHTQWIFKDIE